MASTSVSKLVTSSLRLLNAVQAGQAPTADDLHVGIECLNSILDSWSAERLIIYTVEAIPFQALAGQRTYTLGPGGDWAVPRPMEIEIATVTPDGIAVGSGTGGPQICWHNSTTYGTGFNYNYVPTAASVAAEPGPYKTSNGGTILSNSGAVGATGAQWLSARVIGASPGDQVTWSTKWAPLLPNAVQPTVTTNGPFAWLPLPDAQSGGNVGLLTLVATVNGFPSNSIELAITAGQSYYVDIAWSGRTPQPGLDLPMALLNAQQYASITLKDTPSSFPTALYDDGKYPLRNISLWPVPTHSCIVTLWLWSPLNTVNPDPDVVLNLPPGYERALKFNLALELAAEFGKEVPGQVSMIANESLAKLKRLNSGPHYLLSSPGLNNGTGQWNWITGSLVPWR